MAKQPVVAVKEWVFVGATILSGGIAWGTMTARISGLDNKYNSLALVPETLAALTEKVSAIDKRTADTQQDIREIRRLLTNDGHTRLNNSLP